MSKMLSQRSELSMDFLIKVALAMIVLFVLIFIYTSNFKSANDDANNISSDVISDAKGEKCKSLLVTEKRACVTEDQVNDYFSDGWVRVQGNFKDGCICMQCPEYANCELE